MSCLSLDPKVFEYVHNGLIYTAHNRTCDGLYSSIISSHFTGKFVDNEAQRLVRNWAILNELTYCVAYKEKGNSLFEFINYNSIWKVEPVQLLKYLECIIYNTDIEEIEGAQSYSQGYVKDVPTITNELKTDFKLLSEWRFQILQAIVHTSQDYQNAKWSEEPEQTIFKLTYTSI